MIPKCPLFGGSIESVLFAGAVMNAAKRIQVNLHVQHNNELAELKHLQNSTMLPIYYAEQTGAVTADLANKFKSEVFAVRYGVMGSLWAIMGLAGTISFSNFWVLYKGAHLSHPEVPMGMRVFSCY